MSSDNKPYKVSKQKPLGPSSIASPSSHSAMMNTFTLINGRYKKEKDLGQGSFGKVYSAIDTRTPSQDRVAIKQMDDVQQVAKVAYREIFILRRLSHPAIIPLRDVFSPRLGRYELEQFQAIAKQHEQNKSIKLPKVDNLCLVFDIMDMDLKSYLRASSTILSEEQTAYMLYQMLTGLRYIHSRNVIHRDLKTANVLVNFSDCSVKIADFGLSRCIDPTPDEIAAVGGTVPSSGSVQHGHADLLGPDDVKEDPEDHESSAMDTETPGGPAAYPTLSMPIANAANPTAAPAAGGAGKLKQLGINRGFTKHVITRWYRAPEVILLEPYTTAVDTWSIGCIFAEMLGRYAGNRAAYGNRQALFPGHPCGDLSTDNQGNDDEQAQYLQNLFDGLNETTTQLGLIFNILGSPSEQDLLHLDPATAEVFRQAPQRSGLGLERFLPACAKTHAIDLLKRMLAFDPSNRITIQQALDHPFFDELKTKAYFSGFANKAAAAQNNTSPTGMEQIDDSPEHFFRNIVDELLLYC